MNRRTLERRLHPRSANATDVASEALRSPGRPLDPGTRTSMELRFGRDFSRVPARSPGAPADHGMFGADEAVREREARAIAEDVATAPGGRGPGRRVDFGGVRIHDDSQAADSAEALGALAYTVGEDIVFGRGTYAPRTAGGRALLTHELAHVAQGPTGVVARAVAPQYPTIKRDLSYHWLDWAIRDWEAHEVLTILSGLAPADLTETVQQMDADGLVDRLLDNVADADRVAFASLIQSIHRARSVTGTAGYIERLMSYGLLDWVISDAEAHMALEALKSLQASPARLRDVVVRIPRRQYERFFDNLSASDRRANLRFLEDVEIMRSSGQTLAELGTRQKLHLEARAGAAGVGVGTFIRGETTTRGYGGNVAVWWPSLLPPARAAWIARFDAAVAAVKARAPAEIRQVIAAAEAAGGGITWKPEEIEELGVYAFSRGQILGVGKEWVERAEADPRNVFDNILHELGGHREFGRAPSWEVMESTLAALSPAQRAIATGGPRHPFTAYGYMETEIYSELRELEYRRPGSGGDVPESDVGDKLTALRAAFAPVVAEAVVRGLRRRIQLDERIIPAARALYDRKVFEVFGIRF